MRASVALPQPSELAATASAQASRIASFTQRRSWWIVGACVVAQWLFVAREAFGSIDHNGWLYAHGDDGPWYWTTAWAQTSLHVPFTAVGAGWPYLLTPLAAVFGADMADGLPAVIALNMLVLAPASVVGMYLIGERIAGRLFGVWSAVLWTAMPLLALSFYDASHRAYLVKFFLPTGLGLNALSDFPSMVCAIFAAYLVLRAMDTNSLEDGLLAGVLLGFLVLMKPANGPLPVAAVVALALQLRFRALAATVAGAVPAALALAVWKKTGTGTVPAFSGGGGGGGGGGGSAVAHNAHTYLNIDFHHLNQNVNALGDVFWSVRLLELLLLAGSIGLIARARWKGAFVVGWFVAYGLVKGTVAYSNVFDTSLYRFLLPAWPAWTLICAGVVFCWPSGMSVRRQRRTGDEARSRSIAPAGRPVVIAAAVLLSVLPLAVIVADAPARPGTIVDENYVGAPIPVVDFGLAAQQAGPHSLKLTWDSKKTSRAATTYAIFKAGDRGCGPSTADQHLCRFKMQLIGTTQKRSFVDDQFAARRFYRVGLVEGSTVQVDNPSLLLMSKPVLVAPK
jgi:hypothetical protein